MLNASLTIAIVQENSSMKEISNMTSNNTILNDNLLNNTTSGNISLNAPAANNTSVNITKPKNIESINNTSANTSINLSTVQSKQSNETVFTIGNNATDNISTYKLDVPTLPAKNASNMWYIIQAKPHGYV
ncbi:MAG: hypothetical protein WB392_08650 [Methanotrichaceae archaeon]